MSKWISNLKSIKVNLPWLNQTSALVSSSTIGKVQISDDINFVVFQNALGVNSCDKYSIKPSSTNTSSCNSCKTSRGKE